MTKKQTSSAGSSPRPPQVPRDPAYIGIFSFRETMADFLQRAFPHEPWAQDLDLSTLELAPTRFESPGGLVTRMNDLIWRVRRAARNGQPGDWLYLYLMIEFQSSVNRFMALRMMTYESLLYESLVRDKQLHTVERPLPPTVPIVVYTGARPWGARRNIADLIAEGAPAHRPWLPYSLVDLWRLDPQPGAGNLLDLQARVEQGQRPGELRRALRELQERLEAAENPTLQEAYETWVGVVLRRRAPTVAWEQYTNLEGVVQAMDRIDPVWTDQWKQEGLQEGRKEGLEQGLAMGLQQGRAEGRAETQREALAQNRALLTRQAEVRFGGAAAKALRAALARIDSAEALERVAEWIVACESGDALLARVEAV